MVPNSGLNEFVASIASRQVLEDRGPGNELRHECGPEREARRKAIDRMQEPGNDEKHDGDEK
jgi:hypothetical protein